MSNMSYCRFENTSIDLRDCVGAMEEVDKIGDLDLSQYEMSACKRMAQLAQEFLEQYERLVEGK